MEEAILRLSLYCATRGQVHEATEPQKNMNVFAGKVLPARSRRGGRWLASAGKTDFFTFIQRVLTFY